MANNDLTQFLINEGVLEDERVIKAFNSVDRRDFLPESQKKFYLENRPIPIGYEQTNSQPFTVAFMLELLLPNPNDKVLDVGSGSGWTAALIGSMLDPNKGSLTGVELLPKLVEQASNNLKKYKFDLVKINQAGKTIGWPKDAPYDKIIVSASVDKLPQELVDQLKEGGRMVIPIGQSIFAIEKTKGEPVMHEFPGFIFVPLIN